MKIHKFFIRAYSCSFVVQKVFGSSWISVTITQVRWFPSSSLGTDTTKLQLRVISHDDSNA
jgi:hypothetical protein